MKLPQRSAIAACAALGLAALGLPVLLPPLTPRLVYNASDSMPRGWYLAAPPGTAAVGRIVLVRLPAEAAACAARRGYLPADVPLLKRVAAVAPQPVCVRASWARIDGVPVGAVRLHDAQHRPLRPWAHCRLLRDDEVFVLGDARAMSFDSRYFGPLPASALIARAWPLWTWEAR
ncbi:S26 family signal peptidase [Variovorax sp. LARHSF232]